MCIKPGAVHPGVAQTVAQFSSNAFANAVRRFAVIGEVGLDRRSDDRTQSAMFRSVLRAPCSVLRAPCSVLRAAAGQSVLLSVHSTGRCTAVLDEIERAPHPGMILHWFTGSAAETARAVDLGCYFSVNAAMKPAVLQQIPLDRMLTETDFPASRVKTGATRPGDVARIEAILTEQHGQGIRAHMWRNLAEVCRRSGATERMPTKVQGLLEAC